MGITRLGPTTRKYIQTRKNPTGAVWQMLQEMETKAREIAEEKVHESVTKFFAELRGEVRSAGVRARNDIDILSKSVLRKIDQEISPTAIGLLKRIVEARLAEMPHLKGEPGYTPKKGVDYFDGKPGKQGSPGYTPQPDIDYPSVDKAQRLINGEVLRVLQELLKAGTLRRLVEASAKETLNAETVARALERLQGKKRLSYTALRDTPGFDVSEHQKKQNAGRIHRGGSSRQTYYYDLTDQCNGALKSFTIPTNVRVVSVHGTDAPGGVYRPIVDWTGTGSTTLELTSAVAAPNTGATLYLIYVQ